MLWTLVISTAFGRSATSLALDPDNAGCSGADAGVTLSFDWFVCTYGYPQSGNLGNICDTRDNDKGDYPTNAECFHTGKCVSIMPGPSAASAGYHGGKCECANIGSESPNWTTDDVAYPDPLDWWPHGRYSNTKCNTQHYEVNARVSYIFYLTHNDADSGEWGIKGMLTCKTGADGSGVAYPTDGAGDDWKSNPDMLAHVRGTINYPEAVDLGTDGYTNYPGIIVPTYKDSQQPQHCRICTNDKPCKREGSSTLGKDVYPHADHPATGSGGYLMITYGSNYHTFYDHACARADGSIPSDTGDSCAKNKDRGQRAKISWTGATEGPDEGDHHQKHYHHMAEEPTSNPVTPPGISDPLVVANGLGWTDDVQLRSVFFGGAAASNVVLDPLPPPTLSPTRAPTGTPNSPDCFSMGYTHSPSDLVLVGVADNCRGGLMTEWPGGNSQEMCDSPYVVCLPKENTPNGPNGGFPMAAGAKEDYKSSTHQYSIDECKRECAYDQRCTGFEFWTDAAATTGRCSLIDDIPIVMTNGNTGLSEGSLPGDLSQSNIGGRLCFEKQAACNPYFQEDQLEEAMLNCYCPNNRKGFYTKNVVRTVAATKFCGSDPQGDITKRIREAQANRMFHLCENWCLFNTQIPRVESWYHDPWKECWREQYAGVGTHRSYCYRVIRDPYTIEQLFIDTRSTNMCTKASDGDDNVNNFPLYPTVDPSTVTFLLANAEDSCADACAADGKECNENVTQDAYTDSSTWNNDPFSGLAKCNGSYTTGNIGWAHPSVTSAGECILRNPETNTKKNDAGVAYMATTGCNVAIGVGYQRLCSCHVGV